MMQPHQPLSSFLAGAGRPGGRLSTGGLRSRSFRSRSWPPRGLGLGLGLGSGRDGSFGLELNQLLLGFSSSGGVSRMMPILIVMGEPATWPYWPRFASGALEIACGRGQSQLERA